MNHNYLYESGKEDHRGTYTDAEEEKAMLRKNRERLENSDLED